MKKCADSSEFFKQVPALENKKNKRIAVYTAIFGSYDELKAPEIIDSNVDYFCFTDNKELKSDIWNVIVLSCLYYDPRLSARALKILSHKTMENYDFSVWVDGSCKVIRSIEELVYNACGGDSICSFKHKTRNCIYKEARTCRLKGKDDSRIINKQMDWYKSMGYPKDNGLIESTVLVRKNNVADVITLNEEWWKIVESFSNRDQLSFNFVVWKCDIQHKVLEGEFLLEHFFYMKSHSKMTFYSKSGKKMSHVRSMLTYAYLKLRLAYKFYIK